MEVNGNIFPNPDDGRPMVGSLLVQLKEEPLTAPAKVTVDVDAPLQTDWSPGWLTDADGFTVIIKDVEGPVHPFEEDVISMEAAEAEFELLIKVNGGILPVPAGASPIPGLSFIQLNVAPVTEALKFIIEVVFPLQKMRLLSGATAGIGFTVIANVLEGPEQPLSTAQTVMVADRGTLE
jgi:hypothetical protein